MREIKFRAWDKKSGKYRSIDSIAFHGNGCFDNNSQTIKVVNLWGEDIIEQKSIVCHRESTEVEIEQFTGILDKHGKEIYEGDILDYDGKRLTIFFQSGAFGYKYFGDFHWLVNFEKTKLEVIGNIHKSDKRSGTPARKEGTK